VDENTAIPEDERTASRSDRSRPFRHEEADHSPAQPRRWISRGAREQAVQGVQRVSIIEAKPRYELGNEGFVAHLRRVGLGDGLENALQPPSILDDRAGDAVGAARCLQCRNFLLRQHAAIVFGTCALPLNDRSRERGRGN
jgi:hypothetical protein